MNYRLSIYLIFISRNVSKGFCQSHPPLNTPSKLVLSKSHGLRKSYFRCCFVFTVTGLIKERRNLVMSVQHVKGKTERFIYFKECHRKGEL